MSKGPQQHQSIHSAAVDYSQKHGNEAAAKKYGVSKQSIANWRHRAGMPPSPFNPAKLYDAATKKRAVHLADKLGLTRAAKETGIHFTTIAKWRKGATPPGKEPITVAPEAAHEALPKPTTKEEDLNLVFDGLTATAPVIPGSPSPAWLDGFRQGFRTALDFGKDFQGESK